jgi:hypothetical protein
LPERPSGLAHCENLGLRAERTKADAQIEVDRSCHERQWMSDKEVGPEENATEFLTVVEAWAQVETG